MPRLTGQVRGLTVYPPEGFREAFKALAQERTLEERRRTGRRTRDTIVTVRQLQEEAIAAFARSWTVDPTQPIAGTRGRGLQHFFNLDAETVALVHQIAGEGHLTASAVFLTACFRYLTQHTNQEWS